MLTLGPIFTVIEGGIANTITPGGSLHIPYPNGIGSNDCRGYGHQFILNNQNEYDSNEVHIQILPSYISIVNATTITWYADFKFKLQLNLIPVNRIDGDLYVERNLFVGGIAQGGGGVVGGGFDVTSYGAIGDGETNDYDAILAAKLAMLQSPVNRSLIFPPGKTFLINTPDVDGLLFDQESNFAVFMGIGSKLLMGNLVPSNYTNPAPIRVNGPCENIYFNGVCAAWGALSEFVREPSAFMVRGANIGDGDRTHNIPAWYRGNPDGTQDVPAIYEGAVKNISFIDCSAINTQNAFIECQGVDGIVVDNFFGNRGLGSGFYFQCFRRATISNVRLQEIDDDGLAFLSNEGGVVGNNIEDDFHGEYSTITNIVIDKKLQDYAHNVPSGSIAIGGIRDMSINNCVFRGKFRGLKLEYGTQGLNPEDPFYGLGIHFLASKRVAISNVAIGDCTNPIYFLSKNNDVDITDEKWWRHSLRYENIVCDNNDYLLVSDFLFDGTYRFPLICGVTISGLRSTSDRTTFSTLKNVVDIKLENVQADGELTIVGFSDFGEDPDGINPDTGLTWHRNDIILNNVQTRALTFAQMKGIHADALMSAFAPKTGIKFLYCTDIVIGRMAVLNCNRLSAESITVAGAGTALANGAYVLTGDIYVKSDDPDHTLILQKPGTTWDLLVDGVRQYYGTNTAHPWDAVWTADHGSAPVPTVSFGNSFDGGVTINEVTKRMTCDQYDFTQDTNIFGAALSTQSEVDNFIRFKNILVQSNCARGDSAVFDSCFAAIGVNCIKRIDWIHYGELAGDGVTNVAMWRRRDAPDNRLITGEFGGDSVSILVDQDWDVYRITLPLGADCDLTYEYFNATKGYIKEIVKGPNVTGAFLINIVSATKPDVAGVPEDPITVFTIPGDQWGAVKIRFNGKNWEYAGHSFQFIQGWAYHGDAAVTIYPTRISSPHYFPDVLTASRIATIDDVGILPGQKLSIVIPTLSSFALTVKQGTTTIRVMPISTRSRIDLFWDSTQSKWTEENFNSWT